MGLSRADDGSSATGPLPGAAEARAADMGTRRGGERFGTGGCRSVALGCGIFAGAVAVALVVVGIYLAFHWRSATASFITSRLTEQIQRSPLPLDQQQRIATRIRDIGERFAAGQLTVKQVRRIGKRVFSDPVLSAGILDHAGDKLLERSGLSMDEQADGRRALGRFTHGIFVGSIPTGAVDAAAAPIRDPGDEAILHVKNHVSDAQLRRFVAAAKRAADKAKVPNRAYDIDAAARFNDLVARALRSAQASGDSADDAGGGS